MSSLRLPYVGRRGLALLGAFLVLSLLYSVLVLGQLVAWVVFVLNLAAGAVALWLLWRFVVAVERIAAAAERMAAEPSPADPVGGDSPEE